MSAAVHHIAQYDPRSPQLENGYLRLSNELNQAICRAHLSGNEMAVLMAIVAKTYGFNKKTDDVSASQLGEYCGIARNHVTEVLNSLEAKNIITKRPGRYGSIIGIQKDYSQWILKSRRKSKDEASPSYGLVTPEVVRVSDSSSPSYGPEIVRVTDTQKTTPKDNQQKTKTFSAPQAMPDGFEAFYSPYPKKVNKLEAVKAFIKLNPDADLLAEIISGIERCKKSRDWVEGYIPNPATFLNKGGWMNEIQTAYTAEELTVIEQYNTALAHVCGEIDPTIYSETRAGAIRHFRTLSSKPEFWMSYFKWVAQNATLPPSAGFDFLVSADGFSKVKGGQFSAR
jgi:phage replication O-like protein O